LAGGWVKIAFMENRINKKDLDSLRNELERLYKTLENRSEFKSFTNKPIAYFEINNFKLLHKISSRHQVRHQFNFLNVNSFRKKKIFGRCERCKFTVIMIIYLLLDLAAAGLDAIYGGITAILAVVKDFFDLEHAITKLIQDKIDKYPEYLSTFRLARLICESLNYCP
jgi:hypothetical protein